jgi:hypothetical protein
MKAMVNNNVISVKNKGIQGFLPVLVIFFAGLIGDGGFR